MLGIHDYGVFLAAGIALNLTPGQDTIYVAGRSVSQGLGAGLASALGVGTGALVHVAAAALGLSAVLAASATAFAAVKWAGVAYLVYLGGRMLLGRDPVVDLQNGGSRMTHRAAFVRGILSNVLNPKVAVFFLAFLPQFVDPAHAQRSLGFLALGGTFVLTGTTWCVVVALLTDRASSALRRSTTTARFVQRATGLVFVGLGLRLALSRTH
ncbi:MAG: LysE family translocator [bacterium]|nr:LysE family translocator [bacterium]